MTAPASGDIDFSSLWSWTVPLWGIALLVLFLGGVITYSPLVVVAQTGGAIRRSYNFMRQR